MEERFNMPGPGEIPREEIKAYVTARIEELMQLVPQITMTEERDEMGLTADAAAVAIDLRCGAIQMALNEYVYPPEDEGDRLEAEQTKWEQLRSTGVDRLLRRVEFNADRLAHMIARQAPLVLIEGTFLPGFQRACADLVARAKGEA